MGCQYNNCKLIEGAGKTAPLFRQIDGRYYHEECWAKRACKVNCTTELTKRGFIRKTINMSLKTLLDDDNIDPGLLLFTVKTIISENLELTSPFGIKYYLQNVDIKNRWAAIQRMIKTAENRELNENAVIEKIEAPKFTYKPSRPKWTNIV